jgi:hypothetical protein
MGEIFCDCVKCKNGLALYLQLEGPPSDNLNRFSSPIMKIKGCGFPIAFLEQLFLFAEGNLYPVKISTSPIEL